MRLELTGHHVEITSPLRQLVERKMGKFERMLNSAALSAQVICKVEKYRHVIDVTIHARADHMLHGQGQGPTWQAALKQAADKVEKQARDLKERWKERKRHAVGARQLAAAEVTGVSPSEVPPRVIRAASYAVPSLSVEDAAHRLNDTSDGFLVFRNGDTEQLNVLYRRKDGRFGLIEPEA
jgi:putative sigma-54 modulation protein